MRANVANSEIKRGKGRPSSYTQEIGEQIAARLSLGEPLAQICRDEGMPHDNTVRAWMAANEAFSVAIARARELGYDVLAAECLSIADTPVLGEETTVKPNGDVETKTGDMLGHRKLRIETRLKLLAKWDPKRYGDKIQTEISGGMRVVSATELKDDELAAIATGSSN